MATDHYGSENLFVEGLKVIQFCFTLYLIASILSIKSKSFAWIFSILMVSLYISLIFYFIITGKQLDFMFFYLNRSNLIHIIEPYFFGMMFLIFVSGFIAYFFVSISSKHFKINLLILFASILLIIPSFSKGNFYLNELFVFSKSFFDNDKIIDLYQIRHRELIDNSFLDRDLVYDKIDNVDMVKMPDYFDNIIFLQIESLNGNLMSSDITPNFYKFSERGLSFKNFYANGVQTILGQESILCSLPPSFYSNLNFTNNDKNVFCFPEIFNKLGYKTAFFKTYDLEFTNTGDFMTNIGFSEVHMEDIMKEDDPQYLWGYREDVFYDRAFSYIDTNFEKNKNFLFLEVGPTNHWPFYTPNDYKGVVPHEYPENQKQLIENTMFLQDKHLEIALNKIEKTFPEKNYTIIIVGDHSWPSGEHSKNIFCSDGFYEENFKTGLAMIFGDGDLYKGVELEERFSQMDILPSFMDILGLKISENNFRESFFSKDIKQDKKIILVQPFSEKYLSFISKDIKNVYNSSKNEWKTFSLDKDSKEIRENSLIKEEAAVMQTAQEFVFNK